MKLGNPLQEFAADDVTDSCWLVSTQFQQP